MPLNYADTILNGQASIRRSQLELQGGGQFFNHDSDNVSNLDC